MDVNIRPGVTTDWPLVIDSIVSTLRFSPHAQGAEASVLASLVEPLLQSPGWALSVACPQDDTDAILGFVLFQVSPTRLPVVGWLQVRAPFRLHGIGRALLNHAVGPSLPPEIHTPFMVQRIGTAQPSLVDLAKDRGITLRFRPYLPLQESLNIANTNKED